jgi:pimeloyl-ACP methyl ester carboxylesterase
MSQPTLTATPAVALQPTPIGIVAAGFKPGQRVWLSSRLVDDAGVAWTARALFVADAAGRIDLADAPAEEGHFTGIDPAGLFWSLRPEPVSDRSFMLGATEKAHKLGQPHIAPMKAHVFELQATVEGQPAPCAATTVTLQRLVDGIEVLPLRDGRLRGQVLRWKERRLPDGRARGCIFSFTGSGGGLELGYAPVLASLGYDVVNLAYFAYEDLPGFIAGIPLEYFEEGFAWARRELGCERIGIQGASRGGELVITLASHLPDQIQGVVGIVPMYTTSIGWDPAKGMGGPSFTFRGQPVPHCKPGDSPSFDEMKRLGESEPNGYAATPGYFATLNDPETRATAALPIERARGPVLLISGVDDQMWPSAWGSDLIVNRLRAQGFEQPYQHLCLQETGHITPLPNTVTSFCPALLHSLLGIFLACGGTPAGTARESRRTWDAMVAHYRHVFGH